MLFLIQSLILISIDMELKNILTGDQNITNKDYTKVLRFIKKGYNYSKGEGLNVRGTRTKSKRN